MYEVEIKASIGDTSFRQLLNSAADLGFAYCMTVRETDVYYNGVDRDFMKTDEALRVRTCSRWQEGNPKDSESTLTNAPRPSMSICASYLKFTCRSHSLSAMIFSDFDLTMVPQLVI